MQRVICAGMVRSGSTILYNIARLLFEEMYGDDVYSCWSQHYQENNPKQFHIIKIHKFRKGLVNGNAIVLTSRRDFRDVVASLIRKGWTRHKSATAILKGVLERYEPWYALATYDMVYEEMILDQKKIVEEVSKALGFNFASDKIDKIHKTLQSLSYGSKGNKNAVYNETNLFHVGHATGTGLFGDYKRTLPEDTIEQIEKMFPEWLWSPEDEDA